VGRGGGVPFLSPMPPPQKFVLFFDLEIMGFGAFWVVFYVF